jgi:hypothetical protein
LQGTKQKKVPTNFDKSQGKVKEETRKRQGKEGIKKRQGKDTGKTRK